MDCSALHVFPHGFFHQVSVEAEDATFGLTPLHFAARWRFLRGISKWGVPEKRYPKRLDLIVVIVDL